MNNIVRAYATYYYVVNKIYFTAKIKYNRWISIVLHVINTQT